MDEDVPEGDRATLPVRTQKRWSDLTPPQKTAVLVGGVAELVMTIAALRDVRRRPAAQVRGPKAFWVLTFVVQPFGPLLYFVLGRRRASA
jgi:uncharacterized membrane protein